MPRDNLYLVEIVEAIDRISRWLSKIDVDEWTNDDMLRAAVLQQLTTIGEASRSKRSADARRGSRPAFNVTTSNKHPPRTPPPPHQPSHDRCFGRINRAGRG
ncbi:MAG: HepT-like ribonuclease domain-containing protein [Pseudonocardiaceae bacterium]